MEFDLVTQKITHFREQWTEREFHYIIIGDGVLEFADLKINSDIFLFNVFVTVFKASSSNGNMHV